MITARPRTHEVRQILEQAGVPVSEVLRKNDPTKHGYGYVASFYGEETERGEQYAAQIQRSINGLRIVSTHSTVAHWRPGQPVISAAVYFDVIDTLGCKPRALMIAPCRALAICAPTCRAIIVYGEDNHA